MKYNPDDIPDDILFFVLAAIVIANALTALALLAKAVL